MGLLVLIDGDCGRCRRSARVLGALDWLNRLRFEPLQDNAIRNARAPGYAEETLLEAMHVIDAAGRVSRGYRACLRIGTALPIFWPVLPFGALLLLGNVGEIIYRRVAHSRRRHPMDPCVIQPSQPSRPSRKPGSEPAQR